VAWDRNGAPFRTKLRTHIRLKSLYNSETKSRTAAAVVVRTHP
jgi:hypothetical protein